MRSRGIQTAAVDRREFAIGAGLIAMAAMTPLAATAQDESEGEPKPGGTLKLGVQGDPTELDPHLSSLAASYVATNMAYEGLVQEGPDLTPQPILAESWEISDDGLTYTFALRSGVKFHNGREFTADDVVYSIERVRNPDTASPFVTYLEDLDTIEAPDATTVVFTLARPNASFLQGLCRRGFVVVPQEAVEADGGLSMTMVGTGPFRFLEYVPNTAVSYERNPDYWDAPKPYVDALELQIVPDDTARTTALVSGTVDVIEGTPHKDYEIIEASDGVKLVGGTTSNLRWMVFNTRREPFDRPEIRQAIAAGIQRGPIIDAAVFGHGEGLLGIFPDSFWFGYPEHPGEGDPEAATATLAELGWPSDQVIGLLTWAQYSYLSNTSVVVQEQLRQMGIESEIEQEENATYIARYYDYDFDIAVMGSVGYMDPNDMVQQSFGSDEPNNTAGYSNPEMDQLIADGLAEQDQEARAEIYRKIQDMVVQDAPWVNLFTSAANEGVADRVKGWTHYLSQSMISTRDVWIDEG
jgi:peptide/nickel transport system substrate-binding protein